MLKSKTHQSLKTAERLPRLQRRVAPVVAKLATHVGTTEAVMGSAEPLNVCMPLWKVGAIWKRRRYLPNGDTAKRPIYLPPVQQAPSRLSSTLHEVLADCAPHEQAHLPAIRHAAVGSLFGTVSDPDPAIRSHMRAILQPLSSTTPSAAAQFAS